MPARAAAAALRRHPLLAFALGAAAIVLASRAVVASRGFTARPGAVGVGVTLDLTVTLTALFWMTAVRGRALPPAASAAVLLAGAAAAAAILPPGHRALADGLRLLAGPAELALLGWLAWKAARVARALRTAGGDVPFEDALRLAGRAALGPYRSVEALLSELTLLAFALGSWGQAPHAPAGSAAFTLHRRSGAGAVLAALALAGAGEALGAHFLVAHWSAGWAWALTAFSAYSGLWLLGDFRALVLRPVLVDDRVLRVRVGLRWRAEIPLAEIVRACPGPDPARHRGCAVASPIGPPNLYLHLARAVELEGPMGLRRRSDCVGLRVDDPGALERLLRERCRALR